MTLQAASACIYYPAIACFVFSGNQISGLLFIAGIVFSNGLSCNVICNEGFCAHCVFLLAKYRLRIAIQPFCFVKSLFLKQY